MVAWNKKPLKINVEIRADVMAEIKLERAKSKWLKIVRNIASLIPLFLN